MMVVAAADDSQGPSNIKQIQCSAMIFQVIHYGSTYVHLWDIWWWYTEINWWKEHIWRTNRMI